jgi:hypothetical protein
MFSMGVGFACSIFAGVRPDAFALYNLQPFFEFHAVCGVDFAVPRMHYLSSHFRRRQTLAEASQFLAFRAGNHYAYFQ